MCKRIGTLLWRNTLAMYFSHLTFYEKTTIEIQILHQSGYRYFLCNFLSILLKQLHIKLDAKENITTFIPFEKKKIKLKS